MDHATCAALLLATHFATSLLPLTIRLWSSGDTISNSEKLSMVSLELVFSLPGKAAKHSLHLLGRVRQRGVVISTSELSASSAEERGLSFNMWVARMARPEGVSP